MGLCTSPGVLRPEGCQEATGIEYVLDKSIEAAKWVAGQIILQSDHGPLAQGESEIATRILGLSSCSVHLPGAEILKFFPAC